MTILAAAAAPACTRPVPLSVTAVLAEPVISLELNPMHLDGPLSKAAYWLHIREHGHCSLPPLTAVSCLDFMLPLATWTAVAPQGADPLALDAGGMAWGWACSRARYEVAGRPTWNLRKRVETGIAARYAKDRTWDHGAGALKAMDVPFAAALVSEIRWQALGDLDGVRFLLGMVTALGRLAGQGHGRVLEWRVEEDSDPDGWRDRVMPLAGGAPGSIRAPYWHPSRRMPCTP